MTATAYDLALYAGALFILFLTPGPVWVALIARGVSGGFPAAWPLALGVVIGDVIWPLVAVMGVGFLVAIYADFMTLLRWAAVAIFVVMGIGLIRMPAEKPQGDRRLTRPGMWAGFSAGVLVILSNPKAILFYMGVLPGFFDLSSVTAADIVAICTLSFIVPLLGNLVLALFVDRARRLLSTPQALRRLNLGSGIALLAVAGLIAAG